MQPNLPFERLGVDIPDYEQPGQRVSQPFSLSSHSLFRRDTLKSHGIGDGSRTDYFKQQLAQIVEQTGRSSIPYRFLDGHGRKRSMDGGCLKFVGPDGQDVVDFVYDDGFIVAVTPKPLLLAKYTALSSMAVDISLLLKDDEILDVTTRTQLIDARVGQGMFRRKVLGQWHGRCAVTCCDLAGVIRASHILGWRESDNQQRLDPENGLPLVASLDALFDAGLISFLGNGRMVVAGELSPSHRETLLGAHSHGLWRAPSVRMADYLVQHRRKFGFDQD